APMVMGPEKIAGLTLLSMMVKVSFCPTSSGGPVGMAVAQPGTLCGPLSSVTDMLPPLTKLGGALTGVTVTGNVCVTASTPPSSGPPASLTVTVIVAVPDWLATGVNRSEPALPGLA